MQRRDALRTLTGIFGSVLVIPVWAVEWEAADLGEPSLLRNEQRRLLTDLVEAIIPKTDTPGAAELGVQRFVERMIQDCADEKAQSQLTKGLDKLGREAKSRSGGGFSRLTASQKLNLIKDWSGGTDEEDRDFVNSVKNLAIQGYMSSEYVMTNISKYELVPARYHGCVPVES